MLPPYQDVKSFAFDRHVPDAVSDIALIAPAEHPVTVPIVPVDFVIEDH